MRTLLAAAVTALLFVSCGESHEGRARANVVQDTLRYTDDLTTAEDLLRRGEGVEAAIIARKVYQASLVDPTLYKQRVRALSILGRILQRSAELDSALICYREGLRYAELAGDKAGMGSMWLNIGVALEIKGQYVEALSAELTSLRLKELDSDSLALAHVLHNLSVLYWRQDSIDQAIRMLQRSIAIKRISDSLRLASGLNGLGVLLIEAQQYDSAIAVLRESLVLDHKHSAGAQRDMVLVNMGLAFEGAGSLDSAAHYYEASRTAAKEEGHQDLELRALYSLGDIARKRGRYEEARVHLDSSLAIAIRIGSMEDRKEARGSLVLLYEAMGDYKAAFENQNLYQALSDSLMNEGTEMGMQELRLQYDTEKKDRENNELRITQELAELRAARNRWIAIGIGVLAVAIAVFAWAIVQRNRHRSRERVAELEQQTMRLQMDPHFLFNALNAIPGMYADGDQVLANDHVADLSRFLRLVLETSRRRTIPLSEEVELVERYLRISANRRPGTFSWSVKVMPQVQADRVAIPPMLIQPIVENAIEHGLNGVKDGQISVLVGLVGSFLNIDVKDNGVGPEVAAQRTARRNKASMGMDLVRKRIALFDRHTSATQAVEIRGSTTADGDVSGTVVTIRLRVQHLTEHVAIGDR